MEAARQHSTDMGVNDVWSHTGSDGSSPGDRISAAGYGSSHWGENIAAGHNSPEAVMNTWMNSPGHRENMLTCAFQHIGVGYHYQINDGGTYGYRYYWTQIFARP